MKNNWKIKFIHIGKCGGTFLVQNLHLDEIHLKKPVFEQDCKYLIWVRNPISRFVSAFNHIHHLVTLDTSHYDVSNLTLNNSFAPVWIKNKILTGTTYGQDFDELVRFFNSANNLAESLSNEDETIRSKALSLMTSTKEHIFKGIGWYLDNGEFVKKYNENILFVGSVENMSEDLNNLEIILDRKAISLKKIRENPNQKKHLSLIAVKNILNFYHETDYQALKELLNQGWITKDLYQSYFVYDVNI